VHNSGIERIQQRNPIDAAVLASAMQKSTPLSPLLAGPRHNAGTTVRTSRTISLGPSLTGRQQRGAQSKTDLCQYLD
jgi:hypothetical protein